MGAFSGLNQLTPEHASDKDRGPGSAVLAGWEVQYAWVKMATKFREANNNDAIISVFSERLQYVDLSGSSCVCRASRGII